MLCTFIYGGVLVSAPLQAIISFFPICLMYYYSLQIKMGFKTKKKLVTEEC
jgi:hypothetical protein